MTERRQFKLAKFQLSNCTTRFPRAKSETANMLVWPGRHFAASGALLQIGAIENTIKVGQSNQVSYGLAA